MTPIEAAQSILDSINQHPEYGQAVVGFLTTLDCPTIGHAAGQHPEQVISLAEELLSIEQQLAVDDETVVLPGLPDEYDGNEMYLDPAADL